MGEKAAVGQKQMVTTNNVLHLRHILKNGLTAILWIREITEQSPGMFGPLCEGHLVNLPAGAGVKASETSLHMTEQSCGCCLKPWRTSRSDGMKFVICNWHTGQRSNLIWAHKSQTTWPVQKLTLLKPLIKSEVNMLTLYDKSSPGEKREPLRLMRTETGTLSLPPERRHLAHRTEPWLRKRARCKINIINPQLKPCSVSWHPLLFSYLCSITTYWSNYGCIKK